MTIERPGISRRSLLTTTAVGVPAMGLLGAANLFGAATAKAVPPVTVDGYWGPQTTTAFQWLFGTVQDGVVSSQLASQSAPVFFVGIFAIISSNHIIASINTPTSPLTFFNVTPNITAGAPFMTAITLIIVIAPRLINPATID